MAVRKRIIECVLSPESVDSAIKELQDYKDELHYSHTYWIFLLPLVMIATDVVSGWIQATINSTWDSTKMRKGLFRKGGEMLVVVVAWLIGIAIPLDFALSLT